MATQPHLYANALAKTIVKFLLFPQLAANDVEAVLNAAAAKFHEVMQLPLDQRMEEITRLTVKIILHGATAVMMPQAVSWMSPRAAELITTFSQGVGSQFRQFAPKAIKPLGIKFRAFVGTSVLEAAEVVKTSAECGSGLVLSIADFAAGDSEFIASRALGESLGEKIRNFATRFKSKRQKLVETGGAVEEWVRNEAISNQKYEEIRKLTNDIQAIAKNTGMPEHKIARIKHHVFYDDTHILNKGIGRFDSSNPMADAWARLKQGNFTPNDIKLLEHEYFESKFEKIFKVDYRQADTATRNSRGMNRDWKSPETSK